MKKLFVFYLLLSMQAIAIAQNVGIGVSDPANKLQVNGSFVVTEIPLSTNAAPTPAQTKTMSNGTEITYLEGDSTGRFYDPGGPNGNYLNNLTAYFRITQATSHGIELIVEDMDLGTGDSLIVYGQFDNRQMVFTNNNQALGSYRMLIDFELRIAFKSNNDGNNGRGFSILYKSLYSSPLNTNAKSYSGNTMYFDTKNGAFRIGQLAADSVGARSVAIGYQAEASGNGSIAMGGSAKALSTGSFSVKGDARGLSAISLGGAAYGDYSISAGYSSYSGGVGSIAIGDYAYAIGNSSVALGFGRAYGNNSIALGRGNANAANSSCTGIGSAANGFSSLVAGMFNDSIVTRQTNVTSSTPLFIIGNGDDNANRSNAVVVLKSGNTGIGTNTPRTKLHVTNGTDASYADESGYAIVGSVGSSNLVFDNNEILARNNGVASNLYLQNAGGNVGIGMGLTATALTHQLQLSLNDAAKPTSSSWTIVSDARLKTNVHDYTDGLKELLKIHPVWFTYTGEAGMPKETGVGILAQELQKISPYMVNTWNYKDAREMKKIISM